MLPFNLIGQPERSDALARLSPARDLPLLVVYYGELSRRAFLQRILAAAGYRDPGTELHLLEWPLDQPLDLAGLVRELAVTKVILFGYDPGRLGLHFEVANYFPLQLGGVRYLLADSLEFIEQTKEAGDSRAAGALWNAVKQGFTRKQ
ncbi:hypothetical protein GGR26_002371 [Lewinella marina]|uniref:Uncharacterized protein n=1 Tax=Neolewinella marina TaxID=438751 RepID=A0A2G0CG45_9BACT|nr:hypothetical protein [Neolewinella marina]NJB86603.1 hypothetical protein [Neolewinella marina]PHK98946.1 hypothetical protein CGL56_05655 [Neolewinella marina]